MINRLLLLLKEEFLSKHTPKPDNSPFTYIRRIDAKHNLITFSTMLCMAYPNYQAVFILSSSLSPQWHSSTLV
ncbi:hypothetical protein HUJ04_004681 [Dendroctonus ponderosae]|nr:hypothetical protein HUJ04_004681 [Dendroctonus ponderosae]